MTDILKTARELVELAEKASPAPGRTAITEDYLRIVSITGGGYESPAFTEAEIKVIAAAVANLPAIAAALIEASERMRALREALTNAASLVHAHTGADDEIANAVLAQARAALAQPEEPR